MIVYDDKIRVSGYLHDYKEALQSYYKMIAVDSTRKDNSLLIDIFAAMGNMIV